ncbi:MAG: hypothetical protein KVP17_003853 [Porospora cf. gigantea B]|uniref:uncharacterized protein n=1 Tax=Porospora cf. gigantea B TaxID=2853592 RepID=UPI00357182A3|nr:MAG: hypothetical protein KVP17_003853 [Porospora cf. gigantea B]
MEKGISRHVNGNMSICVDLHHIRPPETLAVLYPVFAQLNTRPQAHPIIWERHESACRRKGALPYHMTLSDDAFEM